MTKLCLPSTRFKEARRHFSRLKFSYDNVAIPKHANAWNRSKTPREASRQKPLFFLRRSQIDSQSQKRARLPA